MRGVLFCCVHLELQFIVLLLRLCRNSGEQYEDKKNLLRRLKWKRYCMVAQIKGRTVNKPSIQEMCFAKKVWEGKGLNIYFNNVTLFSKFPSMHRKGVQIPRFPVSLKFYFFGELPNPLNLVGPLFWTWKKNPRRPAPPIFAYMEAPLLYKENLGVLLIEFRWVTRYGYHSQHMCLL